MTSIASSAVPSQELNLVTDWLRAFLVSGGKLLDQLTDQRQQELSKLDSALKNDFIIQCIADDPIKTTDTWDPISKLERLALLVTCPLCAFSNSLLEQGVGVI